MTEKIMKLIEANTYRCERCEAAELINELRNANPWGHSSIGEAVTNWQPIKINNMKNLTINETDARTLYPEASKSLKKIFESTFGKDFFSQKITDRIKTFEDACNEIGIDSVTFDYEFDRADEIAYQKLKVIIRALNEGWKPNWDDTNERKWAPWFYMNSPSGFRFHDSYYAGTLTSSTGGSRLCFKSEELANYAANQFLDIYKAFLF